MQEKLGLTQLEGQDRRTADGPSRLPRWYGVSPSPRPPMAFLRARSIVLVLLTLFGATLLFCAGTGVRYAGLAAHWRSASTPMPPLHHIVEESTQPATKIAVSCSGAKAASACSARTDKLVQQGTRTTSLLSMPTSPTAMHAPLPFSTLLSNALPIDCPPIERNPARNMIIVLKTGGNVMMDRLPVHLQTTVRCVPRAHLVIVSDVSANVEGYEVHDVIADVPDALLNKTGTLAYYDALQRADEDPSQLQGLSSTGNQKKSSNHDNDKAGWVLDKLKFIPELVLAWKARDPKTSSTSFTDWFLLIEADTYLHLPNVAAFLSSKDPEEPRYFGDRMRWGTHIFAHGGAGIILSRGALEQVFSSAAVMPEEIELVEDTDPTPFTYDAARLATNEAADRWAEMYAGTAADTCCGDVALGMALERSCGLDVTNLRPMLSGHTPVRAPIYPDLWCTPVLTMHHMDAQLVTEVWDLAQRLRTNHIDMSDLMLTPRRLMWRDIYETFIAHRLSKGQRQDWDNGSDQWVHTPNVLIKRGADQQPGTDGDPDVAAVRPVTTSMFKQQSQKDGFNAAAENDDDEETSIEQLLAIWPNRPDLERLREALEAILDAENTHASPSSAIPLEDPTSTLYAIQPASYTSPEACQAACEQIERCLQWSHTHNECRLAGFVRLGMASKATAQKGHQVHSGAHSAIVSGWVPDRIAKRITSHPPCGPPDW